MCSHPWTGVGPEALRIGELAVRIDREGIQEVILATNPTAEGETTASYLADVLRRKGVRVTRISLGIPMGGDLKYMDAMTVQHALKCRVPVPS